MTIKNQTEPLPPRTTAEQHTYVDGFAAGVDYVLLIAERTGLPGFASEVRAESDRMIGTLRAVVGEDRA